MRKTDSSVRGLIGHEIHKHLDLCQKESDSFLGRDSAMMKVKQYVCSQTPSRAFIIHGVTGSGKTGIIGKIATSISMIYIKIQ